MMTPARPELRKVTSQQYAERQPLRSAERTRLVWTGLLPLEADPLVTPQPAGALRRISY